MVVFKSSALGGTTFLLEWAVTLLLLLLLAFALHARDPDGYTVRRIIAFLTLAIVVVGSTLVLVKLPFALAPKLGANPWIALAVAGILTGLTAHWVLGYVSLLNDCTVEISVPYSWVKTCSESQ